MHCSAKDLLPGNRTGITPRDGQDRNSQGLSGLLARPVEADRSTVNRYQGYRSLLASTTQEASVRVSPPGSRTSQ